jgi:hypothetical protein
MDLNSLMSLSEAGVVIGVVLEGTEYVPPIHSRWPWLETVGFFMLVIALICDWHFQSAINEQQTRALIAAGDRIAALTKSRNVIEQYLTPRWVIHQKETESIAAKLKPFAGQQIDLYWYPGDLEANQFAGAMDNILKWWCGWKVNDVPTNHGEFANIVWYDPQDSKTSNAAQALVKALREDLHLDMGGPAGPLMQSVGVTKQGLVMQQPLHDKKIAFVIGTLSTAKNAPSEAESIQGTSK